MTTLLLTPRHLIASQHLLGASTGFLRGRARDWDELVAEACSVSVFAAELAALGEDELPSLTAFLAARPELPFHYLSVHAPSKRMRMGEAERVALLRRLPGEVDAIVVHPDTIDDVGAYAALGSRLLLENMDARKHDGRTADELADLFDALPSAGLCFDVAHAAAVDGSMAVGEQILDAYADRLRHVHVSSLDREGHHVPLREADAERFAPLLDRCRDVPWILEAPLPAA